MKLTILSLFFLFSTSAFAQNIYRDKNYFVICFQTETKTYFFEWDHFIKTSERNVRYFEMNEYNQSSAGHIRNCKDAKFIHDVPANILHSIDEIKNELPDEVLFSVQQVAEGAHVFRTEKTAQEYVENRKALFQPDHPEVLTQLRKEVGDRFSVEVIDYFSKKIISQNSSCSEYIGTCDFYLCQEQKKPCGLDGYNLHFGYKYCSGSKFSLLQKMKTLEGKNWTTSVFSCLQKKSLENSEKQLSSENICREIKQSSYDSHDDCYFEAGFCDLKFSEKEKIFSLIKKEIFSSQTIKQGLQLLKRCSDQKKEELE